MRILHIVRRPSDHRALAVARAQAQQHAVTLLLLQDAVRESVAFAGPVYACRGDLAARATASPHPALGYDEIVALLFAHERVITW